MVSLKRLFLGTLFFLILTLLDSNFTPNVYAAGCSGTIYCGSMAYRCSYDGSWGCTAGQTCAGGLGVCQYTCNQSTNPMSCYSILQESQCVVANAANSCTSGCSIAPDTPCTWIPPCNCTDWVDTGCNYTNECMNQTRTCNPSTCDTRSQCVADPSCVAAPTPSCSMTFNSSSYTVGVGAQVTGGVTVSNIQNGTVSSVTFTSSNTSRLTASSPDSSSPYTSNFAGFSAGTATVTANAIMDGSSRCSATTNVTISASAPSCTVSFNSPNYSVAVGGTQSLVANIATQSGTISQVNFISSSPAIATVNPASDTTSPYSTTATGVAPGSSTVTANVIMGGVTTCSANTLVNVTNAVAWWQVGSANVWSSGNLNSTVPTGLYFNLVGSGGFPGVALYGGSTNLTSTNVSATGWLANTSASVNNVYNSNYFINLIPTDATLNTIGASSISGASLASGGTAYNGYYWYYYDASNYGGAPLTITSGANLGSRKVILIVDGAGLNLQGAITLTDGSGFFLGVTSGNINVASSVGGGSASLEGIYIADGTFSSGTGGASNDSRLWIRGSVAAYGGFNLQRNLGNVSNNTTPAEFFEYAPDQEILFPIEFAAKTINWQEVAP